jgi:hypothetical protein
MSCVCCAGFPVVNFFVLFVAFYVWCNKTAFFVKKMPLFLGFWSILVKNRQLFGGVLFPEARINGGFKIQGS